MFQKLVLFLVFLFLKQLGYAATDSAFDQKQIIKDVVSGRRSIVTIAQLVAPDNILLILGPPAKDTDPVVLEDCSNLPYPELIDSCKLAQEAKLHATDELIAMKPDKPELWKKKCRTDAIWCVEFMRQLNGQDPHWKRKCRDDSSWCRRFIQREFERNELVA